MGTIEVVEEAAPLLNAGVEYGIGSIRFFVCEPFSLLLVCCRRFPKAPACTVPPEPQFGGN